MTINIKIKSNDEELLEPKEVKLSSDTLPVKYKLKITRMLNGDYMISDHNDIYIILMPSKNKILTYAKDEFGDHVYDAQNGFFKYMVDAGVVDSETVSGDMIFGSISARYPEESAFGGNSSDIALLAISKFIEKERPHIKWEKEFEESEDEWLTEPDSDNSTELGEIPHNDSQGSIPRNGYAFGRQLWEYKNKR